MTEDASSINLKKEDGKNGLQTKFKDFSPVPASAKALLDPETALGWSSVASCEPPEGVACEVLLKNHLRGYCSTFKEGHWDFFNDSVVAFKAINLPYANYPEN